MVLESSNTKGKAPNKEGNTLTNVFTPSKCLLLKTNIFPFSNMSTYNNLPPYYLPFMMPSPIWHFLLISQPAASIFSLHFFPNFSSYSRETSDWFQQHLCTFLFFSGRMLARHSIVPSYLLVCQLLFWHRDGTPGSSHPAHISLVEHFHQEGGVSWWDCNLPSYTSFPPLSAASDKPVEPTLS